MTLLLKLLLVGRKMVPFNIPMPSITYQTCTTDSKAGFSELIFDPRTIISQKDYVPGTYLNLGGFVTPLQEVPSFYWRFQTIDPHAFHSTPRAPTSSLGSLNIWQHDEVGNSPMLFRENAPFLLEDGQHTLIQIILTERKEPSGFKGECLADPMYSRNKVVKEWTFIIWKIT